MLRDQGLGLRVAQVLHHGDGHRRQRAGARRVPDVRIRENFVGVVGEGAHREGDHDAVGRDVAAELGRARGRELRRRTGTQHQRVGAQRGCDRRGGHRRQGRGRIVPVRQWRMLALSGPCGGTKTILAERVSRDTRISYGESVSCQTAAPMAPRFEDELRDIACKSSEEGEVACTVRVAGRRTEAGFKYPENRKAVRFLNRDERIRYTQRRDERSLCARRSRSARRRSPPKRLAPRSRARLPRDPGAASRSRARDDRRRRAARAAHRILRAKPPRSSGNEYHANPRGGESSCRVVTRRCIKVQS